MVELGELAQEFKGVEGEVLGGKMWLWSERCGVGA